MISKNPNLLEEGIKLNPDALSMDRIKEEAWKIIEPYYRRQIDRVLEEFGRARATQQGSEDVNEVAQAAAFARVGTLLVDADKHIGGRIDLTNGRVEYGDMARADFDDLLDDIAERVMKTGGQVLVMPADQMPTQSGVAAIYRF
jgi:stalled ribosome rescue protein Dom34